MDQVQGGQTPTPATLRGHLSRQFAGARSARTAATSSMVKRRTTALDRAPRSPQSSAVNPKASRAAGRPAERACRVGGRSSWAAVAPDVLERQRVAQFGAARPASRHTSGTSKQDEHDRHRPGRLRQGLVPGALHGQQRPGEQDAVDVTGGIFGRIRTPMAWTSRDRRRPAH